MPMNCNNKWHFFIKWSILFFLILGGWTPIKLAAQSSTKIPIEPEACYRFWDSIVTATNDDSMLKVLQEFKQQYDGKQFKKEHYQLLAVLGNQLLAKKQEKTGLSYLLATITTLSKKTELSALYLTKWGTLSQVFLAKATASEQLFYLNWFRFFWQKGCLYQAGEHQWKLEGGILEFYDQEGGLGIGYRQARLYCQGKTTALTIVDAEGIYYPFEKRLEGTKGRVPWSKEPLQRAYIVLGDYTINPKKTFYEAQQADLHNFPNTTMVFRGKWKDRLTSNPKASYPVFESKWLTQAGMGRGLLLDGKLSIKGLAIGFVGTANKTAVITVQNEKKETLVKASAWKFNVLKSGAIETMAARVCLYLSLEREQLDSVFHPAIHLMYHPKDKKLKLSQTKSERSKTAYQSSLQKAAIEAELLEWNLGTDSIQFVSNKRVITLCSNAYWSKQQMWAYQGLGGTNPLLKIATYGIKMAATRNQQLDKKQQPWETYIDAQELALVLDKRLDKVLLLTTEELQQARKNPTVKILESQQDFRNFVQGFSKGEQLAAMDVQHLTSFMPAFTIDPKMVVPLYLKMAKDGFLNYDPVNQQVQLRRKLFHYWAAVNKDQKDYDKIKILIEPQKLVSKKKTIELNRQTGVLQLWEAEPFALDENQQLWFAPREKIDVLPHLAMDFQGDVWIGNCLLRAGTFHFDYQLYHLTAQALDGLHFYIYKRKRIVKAKGKPLMTLTRAVDKNGNPSQEREPIQTLVQDWEGNIQIDLATNKSGRQKELNHYPFLQSTKPSRVYYNNLRLKGGSYPRTSFYYELAPFNLRQLNDLSPRDLVFDGLLYTAKIFDPIAAKLRLLEQDLSLGVQENLQQKTALYTRDSSGAKGFFVGKLSLSQQGLLGNGMVEGLGVSIVGKKLTFLPEYATMDRVDHVKLLSPTNKHPAVSAQKVSWDWLPYQDSMCFKSNIGEEWPFHLFDTAVVYLDGHLFLTNKGLSGAGMLEWKGGLLSSNLQGNYRFTPEGIYASSVALILKGQGEAPFGLECEALTLAIDVKKQQGFFERIHDKRMIYLPYNAFQSSCRQLYWDVQKQEVLMKNSQHKKALFTACTKGPDSLVIEGQTAIYNLKTGILTIKGVQAISLKDAVFFPKNGVVTIGAQGAIEPLLGSLQVENQQKAKPVQITIVDKRKYTVKGESPPKKSK